MKTETTETILAQIASYGPFLPGSVRRTTEKRVRKDGKVKVYDAMPIYTYTDPATGKQKSKRIPKAAFERVRELTGKHKGMRKLIARFEAAAVAENLVGDSKKTPRAERRHLLRQHRGSHSRVQAQAGGRLGRGPGCPRHRGVPG